MIDKAVEERFMNAEKVTIAEAKASPKKRKISLDVDIVQVQNNKHIHNFCNWQEIVWQQYIIKYN